MHDAPRRDRRASRTSASGVDPTDGTTKKGRPSPAGLSVQMSGKVTSDSRSVVEAERPAISRAMAAMVGSARNSVFLTRRSNSLVDGVLDLDGLDGIAAQVEERVVDPDRRDAQDLLPQPGQHLLDRRRRSPVRGLEIVPAPTRAGDVARPAHRRRLHPRRPCRWRARTAALRSTTGCVGTRRGPIRRRRPSRRSARTPGRRRHRGSLRHRR